MTVQGVIIAKLRMQKTQFPLSLVLLVHMAHFSETKLPLIAFLVNLVISVYRVLNSQQVNAFHLTIALLVLQYKLQIV